MGSELGTVTGYCHARCLPLMHVSDSCCLPLMHVFHSLLEAAHRESCIISSLRRHMQRPRNVSFVFKVKAVH